jgi:spermidine/putrescine-binding protein
MRARDDMESRFFRAVASFVRRILTPKHFPRVMYVVGLLIFGVSCFQRQPVEFHEKSLSRLDVSGREKEILARIPSSELEVDEGVTFAASLRVLVRSGLLNMEPATDENGSNQNVVALALFREKFGVDVQLETISDTDLVQGQVTKEMIDGFDLLLLPSHWLLQIAEKKLLHPLGGAGIDDLRRIREDFLMSFSPVPPSVNLIYLLPYFRTTYGIYYNIATNPNPPSSWEECFLYAEDYHNWDGVYYLDDPEVTLSIAGLLVASLEHTEKTNLVATVDKLIGQVKSLADGSSQVDLSELRKSYLEEANFSSDVLKDERLDFHSSTFREPGPRYGQSKGGGGYVLSESDLLLATRLINKGLVFGADFREENEDPTTNGALGPWSMIVSHSRDAFGQGDPQEHIDYVIPDDGTIVSIEAFAIPEGLTSERMRSVTAFFNFMMLRPVAASVAVFSERATLIPGATAYVPAEMANSAVYTLPPRERMFFLPLWPVDALSLQWERILAFKETVARAKGED